jgi:anti-sigma regulatory factor (Ser/Thr protein kinase)
MPDCVLKFPATLAAYARASGELRRALEARAVPERPLYNAELVFEEIVSNVIRHGCSNHVQCAIEVAVEYDGKSVVLSFHDNGQPFDPRGHRTHAIPQTLEAAGRGGLGLTLVRHASTRIDYERTRQNRNHITVTIAA